MVKPSSSCPNCGKRVAWHDNIPILSYLLLRGRCRNCRTRIAVRYLLVELLVALLWALVALRFGWSWELPAFLALVTTLVALSVVDMEHRRLPNRILAPATLVAAILLVLAAAAEGRWSALGAAGMGALAFAVPMLALAVMVPAGLGMGDVKLAGYIGLHLGWLGFGHVLLGSLAGFIAGGVAGAVLLMTRRAQRKDPIPFGPFLAAGATVAVLLGRPMLSAWLGI